MRGARPVLALCFSVVVLLCFSGSSYSSSPPTDAAHGSQLLTCNSKDRDALVSFSKSLDSDVSGWSRNVSSNCCLWPGVLCGASSSSNDSSGSETRVMHLELGNKSLAGAVAWKSLLGLDELRTLNLSRNALSGVVSPELFQLRRLEVLDLRSNGFFGELISDGLRNLTGLRHLDLSSNGFSGSIPDVFDGPSKLQFFSARSNNFTGGLPASLSSCSMLNSLDLGNNSLTGSIDLDFARLVRLRTLLLDSNRLVGRIPRHLSSCRELQTLSLAQNNLHGQLPWSFKYLRALSSLSLSGNPLISNVSRALAVLSECPNLTMLLLSTNFIGERMPSNGMSGFESLKILVLANSNLSGSTPLWLRTRHRLRMLDLSFNLLSGQVPRWLGDFAAYLFYLDLSHNMLEGSLPSTLANMRGLTPQKLSLPDGASAGFPLYVNFRGFLLVFTPLSIIPSTLDFSSNRMSGQIFEGLGNLTRLSGLNLSNNNFSGSIPEVLSRMSGLEALDLSSNNLSGNIPPSFVRLTFLTWFSVAYNHLEGQVPTGNQFGTFSNWSYEGNPGLCGVPLSRRNCGGVPEPPADQDTDTAEDFKITFMPLPYGIGVVIGFVPTIAFGIFCVRRRRRRKARRD